MTWDERLAVWWLDEVVSDPAYREVVVPLAVDLIAPAAGEVHLDLGCGEGQVMRAVAAAGGTTIGCDGALTLARRAASTGPVAVCRLPELDWLRDGAVDGAYLVLVLEHLTDAAACLEAAARVVRRGGALVVVANHPAYTAPGSVPVMDRGDGEILWRWGPYLDEGATEIPAGESAVVFHHRPLGTLLTMAADAGWCLERLVELGASDGQAAADPLLASQRHFPRLMGAKWRRCGERGTPRAP